MSKSVEDNERKQNSDEERDIDMSGDDTEPLSDATLSAAYALQSYYAPRLAYFIDRNDHDGVMSVLRRYDDDLDRYYPGWENNRDLAMNMPDLVDYRYNGQTALERAATIPNNGAILRALRDEGADHDDVGGGPIIPPLIPPVPFDLVPLVQEDEAMTQETIPDITTTQPELPIPTTTILQPETTPQQPEMLNLSTVISAQPTPPATDQVEPMGIIDFSIGLAIGLLSSSSIGKE